ncbi:hypothetical protein PMI42_01593 [Bradyrhizobium sp. YR681]|nr:hypothetical protein PMI42_01593 [Bradyrhizobium sp. YR681]
MVFLNGARLLKSLVKWALAVVGSCMALLYLNLLGGAALVFSGLIASALAFCVYIAFKPETPRVDARHNAADPVDGGGPLKAAYDEEPRSHRSELALQADNGERDAFDHGARPLRSPTAIGRGDLAGENLSVEAVSEELERLLRQSVASKSTDADLSSPEMSGGSADRASASENENTVGYAWIGVFAILGVVAFAALGSLGPRTEPQKSSVIETRTGPGGSTSPTAAGPPLKDYEYSVSARAGVTTVCSDDFSECRGGTRVHNVELSAHITLYRNGTAVVESSTLFERPGSVPGEIVCPSDKCVQLRTEKAVDLVLFGDTIFHIDHYGPSCSLIWRFKLFGASETRVPLRCLRV